MYAMREAPAAVMVVVESGAECRRLWSKKTTSIDIPAHFPRSLSSISRLHSARANEYTYVLSACLYTIHTNYSVATTNQNATSLLCLFPILQRTFQVLQCDYSRAPCGLISISTMPAYKDT